MKRNPFTLTLGCAAILFTLSGCSVFSKDAPQERLEGERISILQLQNELTTGSQETTETPLLPAAWKNSYWPQTGGYPNHSMQHLSLDEDLQLAWKASIGQGSTKRIPLTASPIVVDELIYTLNTEARIYAFNVETGKKVWAKYVGPDNKKDENVITGGLAYSNKRIYATNGLNEILALDHKTGEIIWRKKLQSTSQAAPTILDGRIYVMTVDNRLLALNEADGEFLWEYRGISEGTGLIGAASPAANREIVVPVFSSGEITALHVENGGFAWSDSLSSTQKFGGIGSLTDIKALPVIDKGLLIAMNFSGRMAAIDIRSGGRIWERDIGSSNTPWIAGEVIYVLSADNNLMALNRQTGLIHWITGQDNYENADKRKNPINWQGPILVNGRLITVGSHGITKEHSATTGEFLREWKTSKNISITPIVAGQTLYLLSEKGTLYAYK